MNTKRAVITTLASLGVSVVLALAFLFWPRDTTQISEQDAIAIGGRGAYHAFVNDPSSHAFIALLTAFAQRGQHM